MNNHTLSAQPLLLEAAFTIETVAHLRGFEHELLPQAEHLRQVYDFLKRQVDNHTTDPVLRAAMQECIK